jgi:excisionase family DNA binding protein
MAKLLRAVEVAEQLGLTTSTVRQMIYRGELPAIRPTRRAVRVPSEAVDAITRLGSKGMQPVVAGGPPNRTNKKPSL